ncbi:DUF4760 domain-containing protein [Paraburkholderia heleia]|uniref:DUF4760 domain-containing protein n=1 Tax=Paraburkholderia heleia TaxID=634127 RepID=UPI002AB75AA0|nr:hypothetical protein [Paraburkholderia heleia]
MAGYKLLTSLTAHLRTRWKVCVMLAAAVLLFAGGSITNAYWPALGCYWRTHSVGEFIHEIGPFLGVIVATCVFAWQANRARYTMRIDLILKLAERFDSDPMRKTRKDAAHALRESEDTDANSVGELLDFLEQIGFLWARRAIDLDAVYEFFEAWIVPYCQKTATCRARWRAKDEAEDLYSNLEMLFRSLIERELRNTDKTPHRTPKQIEEFLKTESDLTTKE